MENIKIYEIHLMFLCNNVYPVILFYEIRTLPSSPSVSVTTHFAIDAVLYTIHLRIIKFKFFETF